MINLSHKDIKVSNVSIYEGAGRAQPLFIAFTCNMGYTKVHMRNHVKDPLTEQKYDFMKHELKYVSIIDALVIVTN